MDFFAAIQPVLHMQDNSVPDILYGFLVSIALGVTALQFRGEGEVSVFILLNYYRETIDSGLGADSLFRQVYYFEYPAALLRGIQNNKFGNCFSYSYKNLFNS